MSGTWLGRRLAADWEIPALQRAVERERERDTALLAGVLTAEDDPPRAGTGPQPSLVKLQEGFL